MPSAAFERFRFSFFEDADSARQGLNIAALAQLQGEERKQGEDMLMQALPDARAIIGLGELHALDAEPALTWLFETERQAQERAKSTGDPWYPFMLLYLAKALWQIRPDPRWAAAAIDVLATADDSIQRESAAQALCNVRDPETVRALLVTLNDSDALVRHHAARSLLTIHDLPVESIDPSHMIYRVMSNDAARRAQGKRDIIAAIAERALRAR